MTTQHGALMKFKIMLSSYFFSMAETLIFERQLLYEQYPSTSEKLIVSSRKYRSK